VNYYYENNNHFSGYYLWDYFYTEKEIRKLKLNEIKIKLEEDEKR